LKFSDPCKSCAFKNKDNHQTEEAPDQNNSSMQQQQQQNKISGSCKQTTMDLCGRLLLIARSPN
jgi:hypothetical protein